MSAIKQNDHKVIGIVSVLTFLLLWELVYQLALIRPIFTSAPSRIIIAAQWLFANGLWYDIWISTLEFTLGFGSAMLVGIVSGMILGWNRQLGAIFEPFINLFNATPRIALLPLLILWLGIGLLSKVAVVFLGALFPILVNTISGLRTLDPSLVYCARAFGATPRQILLTIGLPSAVPFILAGMRLGVGRGLVSVVVAELVAANACVGYMMHIAGSTFQTDKVFVGLFLIAGTGYTLTAILSTFERHFERWRPQKY